VVGWGWDAGGNTSISQSIMGIHMLGKSIKLC
jgi:hypothetical protein